jgi:hypothetical protein
MRESSTTGMQHCSSGCMEGATNDATRPAASSAGDHQLLVLLVALLTVLVRRFPTWFAVLWAAVLFVPPHLNQGPLLMLEDGLVFGITQGLMRLRTRSIWPGPSRIISSLPSSESQS